MLLNRRIEYAVNTYEIHTDILTNRAHQTLHFPKQSDFFALSGAQEMLLFVHLSFWFKVDKS